MFGGLSILDVVVIILYLGAVMMIGVYASKKIKNSEDFFMGSRQFKKGYMIMYQFGSGTSADSAVSASSKIFTNGLSGIWYLWMYLPITPFFWVIAPILRRMRALTIGDYFELRYNKSMSSLYAIFGVVLQMLSIGIILNGSGSLIKAATGDAIPPEIAIPLMTLLFVFYGMAGGLSAAIITDLVQGILTILFSFILLPFALMEVGGISGIREAVSPEVLQLSAPEGINPFYVLMGSISILVGIGTIPHHMGVCGAGQTELDGRVGFTYGSFLKRAMTIAWALVALAAVVMFQGMADVKPDETFGMVAHKFLPQIGFGVLGIFIATVLSAIMSTCDNAMISASALFTNNIYKTLIKPNESQKHYVSVGRWSAVIVVAGGLLIAFALPGVIKGVELMWKIPAFLGIAFWLGFIWRKTTTAGAWAATLSSFFIWLLMAQSFFVEFWDATGLFAGTNVIVDANYNNVISREISLPYQILTFLTIGSLVGIITSFFTKPVKEERLNQFYGLLRTPVDEPEELVEEMQLPEGKEFTPENKLINLPNWELQKPKKEAVKGFIMATFVVAALVGILLWIIN